MSQKRDGPLQTYGSTRSFCEMRKSWVREEVITCGEQGQRRSLTPQRGKLSCPSGHKGARVDTGSFSRRDKGRGRFKQRLRSRARCLARQTTGNCPR